MLGKIKSKVLVHSCKILNLLFSNKQKLISNPHKILIINPQGIGDMIIFTPVIEAIKRKYPLTTISVLTSQYGAQVLKNNPFVYETIITDYPYRPLYSFFGLVKKLRKKNFEVIIDTSITCFFLTQLLFPYCIGASTRICFQRKGFSHFLPTQEIMFSRDHMINVYNKLLQPFEISRISKPTIYPFLQDRLWAKEFLKNCKKPIIVIHPTCQGNEKIWPISNFSELISKIKKQFHGTIIITTTLNEEHLINTIKEKNFNEIMILFPSSIQKIAALLEMTNLLISIDTSIVHIATTTNTPTICIYGRTSQLFWKPYNSNQIVIQQEICKKNANDVDVDQVIIHPKLCPYHGTHCITAVQISDVWKVVQRELLKITHRTKE